MQPTTAFSSGRAAGHSREDAAGGPPRARGQWWRHTLWALLYPRRAQKVLPTVSGTLLIALSLGIGLAAYNTANNILFITLSLLLSCLMLSGVLSWLNLAQVSWRLVATPPLRVGQTATAAIVLHNQKRLLPTYGLWFDVRGTRTCPPTRLVLRERLEPGGGEVALEWTFRPTQRGREQIELISIGSAFPFGFLHKTLYRYLRHEVLVWPEPVDYHRFAAPTPARPLQGRAVSRLGHSGDLLALRRYAAGDSHRMIHWKATARLRTLMVRQFASESQEGLSLWLESQADGWPRAEQFELLCRFAASFAEDLFTAGRLGTVAINARPAVAIRQLRDLEEFLNQLAVLEPISAAPPGGAVLRPRRNLVTFAPEGARGVAAFIDGTKTAAA